jgi:hypothetical protein
MSSVCRLMIILFVSCVPLMALSAPVGNLRMVKAWNAATEAQVIQQAAREGIETSNLLVTADVRRHSIELRGTVGTPADVRKVIEIVQSSGVASSIDNQLQPLALPRTWPALQVVPGADLSDAQKERAQQRINEYLRCVGAYNTAVATAKPGDPDFRRIWMKLNDTESEFAGDEQYAISNSAPAVAENVINTNQLFRDARDIIRSLTK